MAGKLLLCVSGSYTAAARWRSGKLSSYQIFNNDDSGWSAFNQYLQTAPKEPVHLMLDAVEEDYRSEILPHTHGRDRAEMVARKIKQFYRNTPYAAAWLQGQDSGKRRDDRFLFAAMTNPDLLHHWLRIIALHGAPLAGIYLMPMVSLAAIEKLGLAQPNLLLISQHDNGLRQTFFREQRLRISRFTLLNLHARQSLTTAYAEEIANTRLYLATLKMMPADAPLAAVLLDPGENLRELGQTLGQHTDIQCRRLGCDELAAKLGIELELLQRYPEALHLHLLGLRQPPANLAPAALTANYQRYRMKRALYAASAATALAAATWGGGNFYQQAQIEAQTAQTAAAIQAEHSRYLSVTKQFPSAPTSSENLKQAVETVAAVKAGLRTPERMFAVVSRALEANPNVMLKSLRWKSGSAGESEAAKDAAPAAGKGVQSAVIEAEIRPFKGDYRAAIASIHSFADQLKQDQAVAEINIVQLPLNVSSVNSLSGNTLENSELSSSAPFKLALALRPEI